MFGVARRESGARREFAMNTVNNADAMFRRGDKVLADAILTTGLATFFPVTVAAAGDDTSPAKSSSVVAQSLEASPAEVDPAPEERTMVKWSVPEALHAGWQTNLVRGVDALIANLREQLHNQQLADVDPHAPDYAKDYAALETAAALNNRCLSEEAINGLRDLPYYQYFMQRTNDSAKVSESHDQTLYDKTLRALSLERKNLEALIAIVDGNGDAPAVTLGQDIAYARENPVLYTRWLARTVAIDLAKLGAYEDALATVRPPLPPRVAF
jgi:hypothetical protein